jgi:hypothetical protein
MFKTVTIGPMKITLSASKENPVYKREREVMRFKLKKSIPHRLRMTIGHWPPPRVLPFRPAYRQGMAA